MNEPIMDWLNKTHGASPYYVVTNTFGGEEQTILAQLRLIVNSTSILLDEVKKIRDRLDKLEMIQYE